MYSPYTAFSSSRDYRVSKAEFSVGKAFLGQAVLAGVTGGDLEHERGPGGWGGKHGRKGLSRKTWRAPKISSAILLYACGLRVAMSMCLKDIISYASLGPRTWVVQAHCGTFPLAKVRGAGKHDPSMFS